MRFIGTTGKRNNHQFSIDAKSIASKFRIGDFLKLSPVETCQIQEGFSVVLEAYEPKVGLLSVRSLDQKIILNAAQLYMLDEDATDWNGPKIARVLSLLKDPKFRPDIIQILLGRAKSCSLNASDWVERWYSSIASNARLNQLQKQALMLPFQEKIGLIEGPPETGKTHLLVWTLIALVAYAKSRNRPIKILVTAQTHHAIDQIL